MGEYFSRWAKKYMPDPFLFAVLLTFLTYVLGIIFTKSGFFDMVKYWYQGFWTLLTFSMQMCLILVTGYALATTRVVRKVIDALADIPKNSASAAALIGAVAIVAAYINWGLGLIVGALMARQVALRGYQKKIPMHYPLLGTAGYLGLACWHGGFSGSAPLLVATDKHFLLDKIGIIPVTQTLLSPMNIIVGIGLVILLPILMKMLTPKSETEMVGIDQVLPNVDSLLKDEPEVEPQEKTVSYHLEHSIAISMIIGIMGLAIVVWYFYTNGFALNLDIVNFTFLFVGIILHRRPINYVNAIVEGTKGCSGIILQFPFYSGIMGMMKFSGLVAVISGWFVAISNQMTFPLLAFLSAALVNIFVPSGGGQWAVQGPILVDAAHALGVSYPKTIMALAYGDQWTNLFQPFWALALLGITGLKARQIMGYAMTVMFIGFVYFLLALLIPA
jgi:short-chain fatty acids transporter